MDITMIFPLRVFSLNRLAPPAVLRRFYKAAPSKSPSCTKKGPGRKHKQGGRTVGVWA